MQVQLQKMQETVCPKFSNFQILALFIFQKLFFFKILNH